MKNDRLELLVNKSLASKNLAPLNNDELRFVTGVCRAVETIVNHVIFERSDNKQELIA